MRLLPFGRDFYSERPRMTKNLNILNILLFVIIFPVLAFLIRDYLTYAYAPAVVTALSGGASYAPAASTPVSSYAPVVEGGLFPSASREFKPVALSDDMLSAAEVSGAISSMELIGTFVGEKSFVVIRKKGENTEKTFRVGESVYGAGTLREVRRDSAVISSGTGDFTLIMPKDNIVREQASARAEQPGYKAAKGMVWRPAESVRKTGEHAWVIDQKAILHALDNLGQVLTDARLKPVGGGAQGFIVEELVPGGIFDAIGLKNGDTLKRVNGFEVTSPEKAIQVLSGLRGESKLDLDIVRNGKKIKLQYDIR